MADNEFSRFVAEDYANLIGSVQLQVNKRVKELLFMQSIEGHAREGHGAFRNKKIFPDATIEDVVIALGISPKDIKAERQSYIDEVFEFRDKLVSGKPLKKYANAKSHPLFRARIFNGIEIQNPENALIGMYLASKMDNYSWRKKAEDKYGLKIGGGECIGIDKKKAAKKGLSLEYLARTEHTKEEVEELVEEGLLCRNLKSSNRIVQGYVRYMTGKGTSDDLAILLAGRLYGIDAAISVFLTDAVDTWDKYTPFIFQNGQDEMLGAFSEEELRKAYGKISLPSEDEIVKFIYAIAEAKYDQECKMISNSQRYFLQINKKRNISTIESHLNYVNGKKPKKMKIGHVNSEITNVQMYDQFEKKFKEIYK